MYKIRLCMLSVMLVILSASANASLITNWTITGPDNPTATQVSQGLWDFEYNSTSDQGSPVTFVASAVVDTAGDYSFDWDYSGFHAYFQVTAFLSTSQGDTLVSVGPVNCCASPSNSFNYTGVYSFVNVNAGDTISFAFGGDNFDSDNTIRGTLRIAQQNVSTPSTILIALMATLFIVVRNIKGRQN